LDITPLLSFPQTTAADILGYATSTLSKRWTEVKSDQSEEEMFTWPFRRIKRIDLQASAIIRALDPMDGECISEDNKARLLKLMEQREQLTTPVFIRQIEH
jgi:Ser/Thr protein kinase RdoA (MazF antagonist)